MAESGGIAGRDGEAFAFAFALGSGIDVLRFGIEAKTTMAVTWLGLSVGLTMNH